MAQQQQHRYCYIDFDINDYRQQFYHGALFVQENNIKYGLSSSQILDLGGSELSRIVTELLPNDHEWSTSSHNSSNQRRKVQVRPPKEGNRIIFQLYWDIAPMACENFATLCQNGSESDLTMTIPGGAKKSKATTTTTVPIGEGGKPTTYKNSVIHRIESNFIVQGGDYIFGNGTGGESIYNGKKFKDEKLGLQLKHTHRGILSMGNSGKNSNTSQFFITLNATPQCDGKHVVFGTMISGFDVLDRIEQLGTLSGTPNGTVTITDCGIYIPHMTPASGFWYDQPDNDNYSGISSSFIVQPRVVIIGPTVLVVDKFDAVLKTNYCSVIKLITTVNTSDTDDGSTEAVVVTTGNDENENKAIIVQKVCNLLQSYSVDVILVAPACRDIIEHMTIPDNFGLDRQQQQQQQHSLPNTVTITKENVILECKPLDALTTVYQQSWLQHYTTIWKF